MKVSVLMTAYNVGPYVREAIESVLAQQTTFDVELVIGEDCSKDQTKEIVQYYESAYPGKVRASYRRKNLGIVGNFIQLYRECRGEYIAVLDGDDYWIDPLKLQKQVDFLDRHPDFAICFHDGYARTDSADISTMSRVRPFGHKAVSHFVELLAVNFIANCTVMWRNLGNDLQFPDGILSLKFPDWPTHLIHAQHGAIGYLPEAMAVYRLHSSGLWSQLTTRTQLNAMIDTWKVMDRYFEHRYSILIDELIDYYELRQHSKEQAQSDQEAMKRLLASRGVRIGMLIARLARLPGRLLRMLKSRYRFGIFSQMQPGRTK